MGEGDREGGRRSYYPAILIGYDMELLQQRCFKKKANAMSGTLLNLNLKVELEIFG